MPELPEVETIRRGLERELRGRRIASVSWRNARLRAASPLPLARLKGRGVAGLRRHGKHILAGLDDGKVLLLHLGMTGKLLFARRGEAERPHTHLVLGLDDGRELRFSDPRRFGLVQLHAGEPATAKALQHYGVDALDPSFTADALAAMLKGARTPLKAFLLDQGRIAGIGNIYACEALWRAGLSPRRQAGRTPRAKVPVLWKSIHDVLVDSLERGGTSFNDYVNAIGEPGSFVAKLAVFQREGLPCPACGTTVRRIVQSGRSTFWCPACQR
ncbi:MAG TPA: bifunctional DNA-formamidopyrimidine glycosylase/DNA-(apurinic or apyrimidinic site) lyase [Candidatus Thermoplasmatota archaeon]|nr:bifunctional DNA-formamidopyrimidine glycosylase/DNA-(apurinic or apyrimidinic site) lyase [Candidatus Thermoplasmatota archaeon]